MNDGSHAEQTSGFGVICLLGVASGRATALIQSPKDKGVVVGGHLDSVIERQTEGRVANRLQIADRVNLASVSVTGSWREP